MQDQSLVVNYFKITILCLIPDALDMLIQLIRFGRKGDEYSDITMLLVCICFVSFDVYYYVWALKAQNEVPPQIRDATLTQLKGVAVKLKTDGLEM